MENPDIEREAVGVNLTYVSTALAGAEGRFEIILNSEVGCPRV
jgi:hypothetical protein